MADTPRLPGAFIKLTGGAPGNPVLRRHALIASLRGERLGFFVGTSDECAVKIEEVRAAFPEAGDALTFETHPDAPWGEPEEGGEVQPLRLPTRAAVAEAFGEERARGAERVLGPIEGPPLYSLPVATAILPSGHRLACVGRTEEEAESMRAAAESQGQAEGEAPRERAGTMWIRGQSFPLYRDDTPADIAQRIGGTVDASRAVVPPRAPVIRATNATLFIGGKSYGTLKDVTITEKRPTASRVYNTRGTISMTFTATVNSPALAKMAAEKAPPARGLRRLGWREKRRAAGAKRRAHR